MRHRGSEQRHHYRLFAVLALSLILAACGWHLRGPVNIENLPTIALQGVSNDMRYPLTQALEDSGVTVTDSSDVTLHLVSEDWHNRTVALDSLGRVAGLELNYTLTWQLERDQQLLGRPHVIQLMSNVNQDPINATAASDELSLAKDTLRSDAMRQMLRQLQALSQHLSPEDPANPSSDQP